MNAMRLWLAGLVSPTPGRHLLRARWGTVERLLWVLLPAAVFVFFPGHLLLATQIAIACVFALSLDLVLGYAGIVTLGHAASFGLGAYTAGLLAVYVGIAYWFVRKNAAAYYGFSVTAQRLGVWTAASVGLFLLDLHA